VVGNLIQIEDEATPVCAGVITNPLPLHAATHSTGNIPPFDGDAAEQSSGKIDDFA
jgi:hypothetical protein